MSPYLLVQGGYLSFGIFISSFQEDRGRSECPPCTGCLLSDFYLKYPIGTFWGGPQVSPQPLSRARGQPFVVEMGPMGVSTSGVGCGGALWPFPLIAKWPFSVQFSPPYHKKDHTPLGNTEGYQEHETKPCVGRCLVPSASKLNPLGSTPSSCDVWVQVSGICLANNDGDA